MCALYHRRIKHALGTQQDTETEPPTLRNGSVILSDPVHAPTDPETKDIDVQQTVARVRASAQRRKLFWVFLDHSQTAAPLEKVLDELTTNHADAVTVANLDQALRLCLAERPATDCFASSA